MLFTLDCVRAKGVLGSLNLPSDKIGTVELDQIQGGLDIQVSAIVLNGNSSIGELDSYRSLTLHSLLSSFLPSRAELLLSAFRLCRHT